MGYIDMINLPMELEHLFRVLLAGICGGLIGYERKSRRKEAGTRTHFIVAVGAALIMIVSKYGFMDLEGRDGVQIDPTKVASGIVSGVGFLGAGMIFMRKQTINGLTTAAGIWATAGVGMALGAGLYILGIAVTLIIYLTQLVLHSNIKGKWISSTQRLVVTVQNVPEAVQELRKVLEKHELTIVNFNMGEAKEGNRLLLDMVVRLPKGKSVNELMTLMQEENPIKSLEVK
ncbi:MgtC/SapB family protein [Saccharibacillus kuerlensis]|uniref:Methyltransferase n=1 Tax=Saccharibacillus kuerlensis TaxID=459527 RepID=A0ABQ2L957_9BACL|nr:MgtC/SapB family protein [Saccharibacillus kuerlensis]GGO05505.1 methyltransferase [Saccharibacillus kuerlensis]